MSKDKEEKVDEAVNDIIAEAEAAPEAPVEEAAAPGDRTQMLMGLAKEIHKEHPRKGEAEFSITQLADFGGRFVQEALEEAQASIQEQADKVAKEMYTAKQLDAACVDAFHAGQRHESQQEQEAEQPQEDWGWKDYGVAAAEVGGCVVAAAATIIGGMALFDWMSGQPEESDNTVSMAQHVA